jgi:hypothetical protein
MTRIERMFADVSIRVDPPHPPDPHAMFFSLLMAVFKGVFMLAGWVLQMIMFIIWKLTAANKIK